MLIFDTEHDRSLSADAILQCLNEAGGGSLIQELKCRRILNDHYMEQFCLSIHGCQRLQALESLRLPSNGLTDRSASQLASILRYKADTLRILDVSDNALRLTGLQVLVEEALLLSSCRLHVLNLANNNLDSHSANALATLIRGNASIQTLLLGYNSLRPKTIKTIAKSLCESTMTVLKHLDLTQNKLEDRGAHAIATVLDPHTAGRCRLETLNLCNNKIYYKGAYHLADAFVKHGNTTLKVLDLSNNFIEAEGAQAFGVVLRFSYTLLELNLSRNNIGSAGVELIAQGLRDNADSKLQRLDISWNGIKDDGAAMLAAMLKSNSALVNLNLEANFLCDAGIQHLAEALLFNMTLEELNLTGNQMRDPSPLIEALCHHQTTIQRLIYEQNPLIPQEKSRLDAAFLFRDNKRGWLGKLLREIKEKPQLSLQLSSRHNYGDEEIIALSRQIAKYNRKVVRAVIGGANVSHRSITFLATSLLVNNTAPLQRLYIDNSPLVADEGIMALAKGLVGNQFIRCLCVKDCCITTKGATELAVALKHNSTLQRLSLEGNDIGDEGFRALWQIIQDPKNQMLKLVSLNVGRNKITDAGLNNMMPIRKLDELHLHGNFFTDRGALDLAKAVMDNKSLRWLGVKGNSDLSWKGVHTLRMFLHIPLVLEADSKHQDSRSALCLYIPTTYMGVTSPVFDRNEMPLCTAIMTRIKMACSHHLRSLHYIPAMEFVSMLLGVSKILGLYVFQIFETLSFP